MRGYNNKENINNIISKLFFPDSHVSYLNGELNQKLSYDTEPMKIIC